LWLSISAPPLFFSGPRGGGSCARSFFLPVLFVESLSLPASAAATKILVCQNKDCRRRWGRGSAGNLPDAIRDLLPPTQQIEIETTGCLSMCDKGPNVCVVVVADDDKKKESEYVRNGVADVQSVRSDVLECPPLSLEVPAALAAAVAVIERGRKGTYVCVFGVVFCFSVATFI